MKKLLVPSLLAALGWVVATLPAAAVIPTGFSDVVVYGSNSVAFGNGAVVVSGDLVVNDSAVAPTLEANRELAAGKDASFPTGYEVKADRLKAHQDTMFGGDVYCNDLSVPQNPVVCSPLALPVFPFLPIFVTGPSNGPDVDVGRDEELDLSPGDYGDLTLDQYATVRFTGGVYNFRSIEAKKGTAFLFLAPSEVRVAEDVDVDKESTFGPAAGSGVAASEVVVYVAGDGITGNALKVVTFDSDATIGANFYAPTGTITLGPGSVASGAFVGFNVDVQAGAQVSLDTYFFNRPPVAGDDGATVAEGGTVSTLDSGETSLLANDSDPDGDNLVATTTPVVFPAHGALVLNADGTFSYTHDGSETLSDSFVYEVCDDGTDPGPLCDTATVGISVLAVTATQANPQSASTVADTPVIVTLTGAADAVDLPLVFSIVSPPAHGTATPPTTVSPTSANTTYLPTTGFAGSDQLTFQVEDTKGVSDTAVVSIEVIDESGSETVNAFDLSLTLDQDTPVTVTLTATTTSTEPVVFSIATAPANGTLGPLTPGDGNTATVVYTPSAGFTGHDSFSYDACITAGCDGGAVTLTVRPVAITVSITKAGAGGGSVSSLPVGIDCGQVCSAGFSAGFPIRLFAEADRGSVFAGWSGDPDCADGLLTPDADKGCTATFDVEGPPPAGEVTVSVSISGAGTGRVTSTPAGIDCGVVCAAAFDAFTRVELTATADPGSEFGGWGGAGDCLDGQLVTDRDLSCIASFAALPADTFTLTVIRLGAGVGAVVSSPLGISCGADCAEEYAPGSEVRLSTRPDPGSTFLGWGGDCSGAALYANVVVDADKTCTATYGP